MRPVIYFDLSGFSTGRPLTELLDNVRQSAIFLAIVSPSYVTRKWTRDELQTFRSTEGAVFRMFPIEVLPLELERDWPQELRSIKRAMFWYPEGSAQIPVTIQYDIHRKLYFPKIETISEELKRALKQFTTGGSMASVNFAIVPKGGEGSNRKGNISGVVFGVDEPAQCKIVIYAKTNKWYVQPLRSNPFTDIDERGRWSNWTHLGRRYAVLVVRRSYQPPARIVDLPAIGGDIIGKGEVPAR